MTTRQPTPGVHENFAVEVAARATTDAAQLMEALESAGAGMANICFNLSQDGSLPASVRQSMKTGQMQWDAALRALRAARAAPTPSPQSHVVPTASPWQWWAGSSEEWCTVGPEDTREAIIQAATNDSLGEFEHEGGGWNLGFYIVEARQDPLRLADWIESDRLLERAEDSMADSDRTSSEYDDGPWFKCTPEQEKDLEERVKRACDEWQAAHKLAFSCPTFSHTRNQEHVIVELPDDRATTEDSDNG